VWFASCFWAWILILLNVNHILICMYHVSFKIFVYSVLCVLIAMKHCKHWHKSTRYIDSFFFNKVVQNCTEKVKRRLFFCRFWKISANLITPPKKSSRHVNRFLVLSQVFLPNFLLFPLMLDTFWNDGH